MSDEPIESDESFEASEALLEHQHADLDAGDALRDRGGRRRAERNDPEYPGWSGR